MIKIKLNGTKDEINELMEIMKYSFKMLDVSKLHRNSKEKGHYRCTIEAKSYKKEMYGVYEVWTWDDVSYRKMSSHETMEDAEKECEKVKRENPERMGVCYTVMSDREYSRLMSD